MEEVKKTDKRDYIRIAQFFIGSNKSSNDAVSKLKLRSIIITNIIERGIDINYRIKDEPCNDNIYSGYTLLHFATLAQDLNSVETLLNRRANFTIMSENGQTPLHMLVEHSISTRRIKHKMQILPLINTILSAHIKTDNTSNPICRNGISHFHISCMVNNLEAVEFFLNAGVSVNQSVSMDSIKLGGYTPLHLAVRYSCLEVAEKLIKHGADVTIKDSRGMSPLHLLIEGTMEIMDVIIMGKRGFSQSLMNEVKKNKSIINLFLSSQKFENFDYVDDYGITKLHIACTLQDKSAVEEFLKAGVDINAFVNTDSPIWPGYTALHFAAHFNVEIFKLLIKNGANIAAKDVNGITPFDLCMQRCLPEDIFSILLIQNNFKDIILSDDRTKLLDFILALKNLKTLNEFFSNLVNMNAAVPNDSLLWPGYTLLHLALLFAERSKDFQDFYDDFDSEIDELYCSYEDHGELEEDTDLKKVKLCLRYGANVNIKAVNEWTPIHLAFRLQREKIVKILLDYYKCKDVKNPLDETNLSHFHIACAVGEEEIVKIFLDSGVDVNIPMKCSFKWYNKAIEFPSGNNFVTIRENSSPLHIAVMYENDGIIRLLLNRNADPYIKDAYDLTPIHLTLDSNTFHSRRNANLLLTSAMNFRLESLRDSVTKEGLSHLHVAAFAGNDICIEELLRRGANVNASISYNEYSPEELSFLSKFSGCTPLHCAVMNFCPRTIELLIEKGANIHAKNSDGRSPLQLALENERYYVEIFVSKLENEKLQDTIDESGLTLLHLSCAKFDKQLVKSLLEKGVNANAVINKESRSNWSSYTPLHVLISEAVKSRSVPENLEEIVQLLLDYGADISIIDIEGSTPLHLTYEMFVDHNAPYLLNIADMMLKQPTAKVNLTNNNGLSHFHLACFRNNIEVAEIFLKEDFHIDQPIDAFGKRDAGYTPLHFAINYGSEKLALILLEHGADFTAEDSNGDTLLHLAVKKELPDLNFVQKILSMGADINHKNIWGESLFELLLKSRNSTPEQIEFFLNHGCQVNVVNPVTMEGLIAITMNSQPRHLRPDLKPAFKSILSSPDIKKLDTNGFNAIHNIVSNYRNNEFSSEDYTEVIERLLELGSQIDQQDRRGRTALHVAVEFKNVAAVTGLIQLGADTNITEINGKGPFSYSFELLQNLPVRDLHIMTTFVVLMRKMIFVGLHINQVDLNLMLRQFPLDTFVSNRYVNEMKEMQDVKLESVWTLKDFLSESGLIVEYPAMSQSQQKTIDEYFKHSSKIRKKFPELSCLLMLQYRKALIRVKLVESAIDAMISIGIHLPELCLVMILKYFKNDDLKFLIESAPKKIEMYKRLKTQ